MKVVLASKNPHKLVEISKITEQFDMELVLESELGVDIDVEKTGTTFEENSLLKAKAVMEATKLPAIADEDVAASARQVSVLMGWGMEDSLETADSLQALGWGSGPRSSYQTRRIRLRDGLLGAVLLALCAASAACAVWALRGFGFYPSLHGWVPAAAYLPFALLLALPFLLHLRERLLWR